MSQGKYQYTNNRNNKGIGVQWLVFGGAMLGGITARFSFIFPFPSVYFLKGSGAFVLQSHGAPAIRLDSLYTSTSPHCLPCQNHTSTLIVIGPKGLSLTSFDSILPCKPFVPLVEVLCVVGQRYAMQVQQQRNLQRFQGKPLVKRPALV